jgi:hypothetical protein
MLNFSNAQLCKLAAHTVGNKTMDEPLSLTDTPISMDENVQSLLLHYFVTPFKNTGEYYHLFHTSELGLNEVYAYVSRIFDEPETFLEQSQHLAKHLYEKSDHPKIKQSDFYVAYFTDCVAEDEVVECIGLFKSENKQKFLKVYTDEKGYTLQAEEGIDIHKLDKGCLIFNTEKEKGYLVTVVDPISKQNEARYWKDEFLNAKNREDSYFHTQGYMKMYQHFVEEKLQVEYEVTRADEIDMKNRTVNFFKEKETFDFQEFAQEVIQQPEIVDKFREFKQDYQEENQFAIADEFTISDKAVKRQAKIFKSVIKLDKNFHIYVHGKKEYIERGTDEVTGLNFYKLLFLEEN